MHEEQKLIDRVSRTRIDAKAAYKKWQITPDDSKLMKAYADAWGAHQKAYTELFLYECENNV